MLSPLAQRLLQHIRKRDLMRAGDRVAVAVSGGADSVALLRLMLEIRDELGVVLSVAHFNHKIRGEASDADEAFVRELAARYSLDFHRDEADVPAHARERKMSLETAARELRYAFLRQLVCIGSCNKVATAHTLDDQAETLLMRIIRGSGIKGLGGIHPRMTVRDENCLDAGEIVRPLLPTSRRELEDHLQHLGQSWTDDASNTDLHHTRNRVRHLVIPVLEREFNPVIRERLAELADIARGEEQFWTKHVSEVLATRKYFRYDFTASDERTFYPPDAMGSERFVIQPAATPAAPPANIRTELPNVVISCPHLLERSLAEQRRIIRRLTENTVALNFDQVERVLELARGDAGGVAELLWGIRAWRSGNDIHIGVQQQRLAVPTNREYQFVIPAVGMTEVNLGKAVLRIDSRHGTDLDGALDIRQLNGPQLIIRPWRPGDRFWPQHSSGPKKVKELLTDKHISGPERQLWPVIACGDDIVWLRGFGVAQPFAAPNDTTDAIVITEHPLT